MSNFTNNRWFTAVILLLLTANIVTLALLWTNKNKEQHTEEHLPPPQGGGNEVFEFLTHELNLDSVQQQAYSKMRDEHRAGAKLLQDSIRKAKDALFALLKQQNTADSVIAVYSRKAADAGQALDELTFRHFQKLRAICNAAQQEKFDKIIQDALRMMRPPRRQGPPPPPGMHHPEDGPPGPPPGN